MASRTPMLAKKVQVPKEEKVSERDPRNTLNDLTGSEWIAETKSFFFQKGLGPDHPHAEIERQHPAPFSFQDVKKLIEFFTKKGHTVLDPFSGVGSTAKASAVSGRRSIGIELSKHWHSLANQRLADEAVTAKGEHRLIRGDSRLVLPTLPEEHCDFIVTSPPYWSILTKKPDHKALERVNAKLATVYSDDPDDLGNISDYSDFLDQLAGVMLEAVRVLKAKRYMAVIVSDFRHGSRFYPFHADLIAKLDQQRIGSKATLSLQGVKVLLQNHKSLKPYGYPFAYVENVHHQYVLIFQKQPTK